MNPKSPLLNLQILGVPAVQSDERCAEIRQFLVETHTTHVAQMVTIEPEGMPFLDKVVAQLNHYESVADRLGGQLQKGVLIQTLIGHGDRGSILSEAPFQLMVGMNGETSRAVYCPLDPGFRAHTMEAVRLVAEAAPDFILFDDDVRYFWHGPSNRACFCPLHMAQFSLLNDRRWERPDLAEVLSKDASGAEALRTMWVKMIEADLVDLFDELSTTIARVSPSIRQGFCFTRDNHFFVKKIASVLGRHRRPIMRTHGPIYLMESLKRYPVILDDIIRQKNELCSGADIICEADTYPHTPFHTSARFLKVHVSSAIINGFDGWKAWLLDLTNTHPEERREYRDLFYTSWRYWEVLRGISHEITWRGVAAPLHLTRKELCHSAWNDYPNDGLSTFGWAAILGRLGIAHRVGQNTGDVSFLTEETARLLSDIEVRKLLGQAAVLDGSAAEHLTQRGFADLLGITAESAPEFRCNYEWLTADDTFNGRAAGRRLPVIRGMPNALKKITRISESVFVPAWYVQSPYYGSPTQEELAPSITAFANKSGGRVVVFASPLTMLTSLVNVERKWQLESLIGWCLDGSSPLLYHNTMDASLQYGTLSDGSEIIFITNLTPDDAYPLEFSFQSRTPRRISELRLDGESYPVQFSEIEARIVIDCKSKAHSVLLLCVKF